MKFAFIRDHQDLFPVELQCGVLDVSRSGFYAWINREPSPREQRREQLVGKIHEAHRESNQVYGSPRVFQKLKLAGVSCCENTVAKLMRSEGLKARSRKPFRVKTTDGDHQFPVATNVLNREFYPNEANAVWTADITYIATREGWLYLAVVIDLFSRRVVGWATADHMRTELIVDALRMALKHRRPTGPLLHHSDRGSQYASEAYQKVLEEHGIEPSMSRRGNCYDNAVTESFFSTLKRERVAHENYATHVEAHASLFEYIEIFYNRQRLHSTLGYRSPVDFELRFAS